jgi:cell division protein FtsI/penicillin-binding protein 2
LREVPAQVVNQITVRPETLSVIRDGMIAVLETQQSRAHKLTNVVVAGKTGTAEYPGPKDERGIGPTHGWFTAFAPAEAPRISLTVFVEKGGGPSDALPIAMDILKEYLGQGPAPIPTSTPTSRVARP